MVGRCRALLAGEGGGVYGSTLLGKHSQLTDRVFDLEPVMKALLFLFVGWGEVLVSRPAGEGGPR